ncbi:MAG: FtsB family cell division protein [Alphaproteobacteria bacterium]
MNQVFSFKNKNKKISISILFIGLFIYFCYHAINGDRGIIALFKLTQQVNKLHTELDNLRAERIYLEHKVSIIRPESLDLDLVDEQARKLLGYADKDEIVYFID